MTNIVRIVDADWSGSMRNDLISRQGAIDALGEKPVGETDWDLGCRNQWEWDTEILRTLPSAEPERKTGKWLPHPHEREWDVCSVCGTGCKRREFEMQFGQEKFTEYGYQYCPHCGARLERE